MDYKVFYRKYRPKNFTELVGQESIKDVLINSIKTNKIAHAYIFTGPRGTGKTSTAKIFAKTLNCLHNENGISCDECDMCKTYNESADIIEIDAASNNGVEEIRNLRDSVKVAPYNSKYKVYIIDEVHMLSNSAWNAFLKTLEEPPSHVIFILATTEINKIPDTVMSRCQRFDFTKIPFEVMKQHLHKICQLEHIEIDNDALEEIVNMSNGCLRDALSYLDKTSKLSSKISSDIVEKSFGFINKNVLGNLLTSIENNDYTAINKQIDEISNCGITPLNFINEFVEYLLNIIIDNQCESKEYLLNIRNLIFKLNDIVQNFNSIVNPFTLIKVELLSINYFPGNNDVNISHTETLQKSVKNNDIDKQYANKKDFVNEVNVKIDEKNVNEENDIKILEEHNNNNIIINDEIKKIRINNSFYKASKDLKQKFLFTFQKVKDKLSIENNFKLLGMIENATVEVVSSKNVIFSFNNANDAIIFNENVNSIEKYYNEKNNSVYKFIAISLNEWDIIRQEFIKNKGKVYSYIDENDVKYMSDEKDETFELAESLFGNDILEVN